MQNAKMEELSHSFLLFGRLTARDISEYRVEMDVLWDLQFNQLDAPRTEFRCQYVTDGQAILYEELYGASAAIGGALRGDRICFAVPNEVSRSGRWKGQSLPDAALAYAHGGKMVDVCFPVATSNLIVILPRVFFAQRLEELTGWTVDRAFPLAGMHMRLAPASMRRLSERLRGVLSGHAESAFTTLQDKLSDVIIEACADRFDGTEDMSPAAWHHFRRAIESVNGRTVPLRLAERARHLGVTLRSVETAFDRCAGISPATYFRRVRLNRVREDLIAMGPSDTTVTEVATMHGFTELGRFAGEYQRVFGELPSQTLQQRSRRDRLVLPALRA